MKTSVYHDWTYGYIGNFGGFQTTVFDAFGLADSTNKRKLMSAFPEWFNEADIY